MKTLQKIAADAFDDIVVLHQRLEDARTMFQAILCALGTECLAKKLALIGEDRCEEWAEYARLMLDSMDEDLRSVSAQQSAAPQKPAVAKRGAGGAA